MMAFLGSSVPTWPLAALLEFCLVTLESRGLHVLVIAGDAVLSVHPAPLLLCYRMPPLQVVDHTTHHFSAVDKVAFEFDA